MFRELASPLAREKVREGDLTRLLNQAAGLSVSIGAALGGDADFDVTMQTIGRWTEYRMKAKNISFDDEVTVRRARFLP